MNILAWFLVLMLAYECVAPPVTEKKKKDKNENPEINEVDSQVFDVEYKRYLQEVVNVLEGDEEFRNRLMKADPEDIKNGKIAKDLEFVNHNVRSKLDELKRQELERLRHAAIQQYEYSQGIDKKHLKIPGHVDPKNPHTFETEDLRKLITHTAKELEDADRQRKDEFKEYEMQKELQYQEQLKHMDEKNRVEAEKQHESQVKKHHEHQPLHHPGSKQQLEQVWEEQDHLSPEDFNPKTFFHLHDLDGNGVWDANEVKALFKKELDKMYDPNAPEDDVRERFEEMERMREHVFNETDTNRDQLISYNEFLEQTKRQEFERDEGWKGLDEQPSAYSQDEYKTYANEHEEEIRRMIDQGLVPPQGFHPNEIPQNAGNNFQQQQHYQPQAPPQYQQQHPPQGQVPIQHQQHQQQFQQQVPPQHLNQHQGQYDQQVPQQHLNQHQGQYDQQHPQAQAGQHYPPPPGNMQHHEVPVNQQHHEVPVNQQHHEVPVNQQHHEVPVNQQHHGNQQQQPQHAAPVSGQHVEAQPHQQQNLNYPHNPPNSQHGVDSSHSNTGSPPQAHIQSQQSH